MCLTNFLGLFLCEYFSLSEENAFLSSVLNLFQSYLAEYLKVTPRPASIQSENVLFNDDTEEESCDEAQRKREFANSYNRISINEYENGT